MIDQLKNLNSVCRRIAILLMLATAPWQPAMASTILSMEIDEIANQAELIFEGEVIQHRSQRDVVTGIINTYVTFTVNDVVKGEFSATELELKFAGGSSNGETVEISGLIIPKLGEQGIYFIESATRSLINPLLGWSQGHYLIVEENGERLMQTVNEAPVTDVMPTANIPSSIKRPQALLENDGDGAIGIVSDVSALSIERALSADAFKARIKNLLEP